MNQIYKAKIILSNDQNNNDQRSSSSSNNNNNEISDNKIFQVNIDSGTENSNIIQMKNNNNNNNLRKNAQLNKFKSKNKYFIILGDIARSRM